MAARKKRSPIPTGPHTTLVLQGGGALGAYQAGVFEQMSKLHRTPSWVAGVSIGAINAAVIAGNAPNKRIKRLTDFWHTVSEGTFATAAPQAFDQLRAAYNHFSAVFHMTMGVNGFYKPRIVPPFLSAKGTRGALSLYDNSQLRTTLERLVDFDRINAREMRLSVGAVNIRTGNSQYFDNTLHKIGPEHIMASGALPPAFAPVEIDGQAYWDGGLVSNTPLQYVLDARLSTPMQILSVDLFSARGAMPEDLASVLSRQKDIAYSSRTRYNADMAASIQNTRQAVRELLAKLPATLRADPGVEELTALLKSAPVNIVHLIYREKPYEHESKDYEFSRSSMLEHWAAGTRDMADAVLHPEWLEHAGLDDGVTMYDLARPH